MTLLQPLFLLLGGAALVPLLVHLLRRRIGRRVEFPAVRYLERAEREHSRNLRLRNIALMLLRLLIVVLLALAASGPLARLGGSGHAATAIAVVVDNSMSSGAIVDGRPALDRLRAAAAAALARAAPDDRLWLVTADGRVRGGSRHSLGAALADLTPLAGAGDPGAAVVQAAALVRAAPERAREVAILTDGQRTSWPRPIALAGVDVRLFTPVLRHAPNHAVIFAAAEPPRWTPDGGVVARLTTGGDTVAYRVVLEGVSGEAGTLARGTTVAPPPDAATIALRAAPAARGWLAGMVETEPDELRGDDRRVFAVHVGPAPAVALSPAAGPFARATLDALVEGGRARMGSGIAVLPVEELTAVGTARPNGLRALLIAPADPVRVGAANRALERAGVPWRLGAARHTREDVTDDSTAPSLGPDVVVTMRYPLARVGGGESVVLARAGGQPWIVAGAGYVLVASPLDPSATTLPLRASWAPWVAGVLSRWLADEPGAVIPAAPGTLVTRPPWADTLLLADSTRQPLTTTTFAAPTRVGVYFFVRDNRRVGALAVNVEAKESVLEQMTAARLAARFTGVVGQGFDDERRWSTATLASPAHRPLAGTLLLAALLALVAESLLARARLVRPA